MSKFEKNDNVYVLHNISENNLDCYIDRGIIDEFVNSNNPPVYVREVLLFRFKYWLDNNMYISDTTIKNYCYLIRLNSTMRYKYVSTIIYHYIDPTLIHVNKYSYFEELSSIRKDSLVIYLNFLKRVEFLNNIDKFITNYFR